MSTEEGLYLTLVVWLVASTQALVNLIAIEATKPHRRRFFRLMTFPLAISLLTLKSAYELILILSIQYFVVCFAAALLNSRDAGIVESDSEVSKLSRGIRFDLRFLFGATSAIGFLTALVIAIPELNREAWISILVVPLAGCVAAVFFLLHVYLLKRLNNPSKILRRSIWYVALVLAVAAFSLPAWMDFLLGNLIPDVLVGWPPNTIFFPVDRPIVLWFPVGLLVTLLLFAVAGVHFSSQVMGRLCRFFVWFLVAALPLWVMAGLLKPNSFPQRYSSENTYSQIIEIGRQIPTTEFGEAFDWWRWRSLSTTDQQNCVEELQPLLKQMVDLSSRDCYVPLTGTDADIGDVLDLRSATQAFKVVGDFEMDRNPQVACDYYLQGCKVSVRCRANGLVVHDMTRLSNALVLVDELRNNRRYFSVEKSQSAAQELIAIFDQLESIEVVEQRDEIWNRNHHWLSSTRWILSSLVTSTPRPSSYAYRLGRTQELAQIRLLSIGLILDSHFTRHGSYPESLDAITAFLPSEALLDPHSPTQERFKYQKNPKRYLLYSVGDNGIDDGGLDSKGLGSLGNDLVLE